MFWEDNDDIVSDDSLANRVVDVVFRLSGTTLPVNYVSAFALAMKEQIQWWYRASHTGFYFMMASEQGNGWYRDSNPEGVLYLSRRNKLVIRCPIEHLQEIESLTGRQLDVHRHKIKIHHKHNKALNASSSLYAQHVISHQHDEVAFLTEIQRDLLAMDIHCKKIICGKTRPLLLDNNLVNTRSLMLNELTREESLSLQCQGLGMHQKSGCGLFIPYKTIS